MGLTLAPASGVATASLASTNVLGGGPATITNNLYLNLNTNYIKTVDRKGNGKAPKQRNLVLKQAARESGSALSQKLATGGSKSRTATNGNLQQLAAPSLHVHNDNYRKSRQKIATAEAFGSQQALIHSGNMPGMPMAGGATNSKSRKKSQGRARQPTSVAPPEGTGGDRLVYLNLNQY